MLKMKKTISTYVTSGKRFVVYLIFLLPFTLFGQTPTYQCDIRNESFVSANEFQFDIYLSRTGTTPFELACFQTGLLINSAFLNGGTISAEIVPSTSGLKASQAP